MIAGLTTANIHPPIPKPRYLKSIFLASLGSAQLYSLLTSASERHDNSALFDVATRPLEHEATLCHEPSLEE